MPAATCTSSGSCTAGPPTPSATRCPAMTSIILNPPGGALGGSLGAEGDGGVDARGARGGEPAGGDADRRQHQRHGGERGRVVRGDAEEEAAQQPRGEQ